MPVETIQSRNKKYELFYAKDGHIELYEVKDPSNGFIFNDEKEMVLFINSVTDHLEKKYMEKS